MLHICKLKWTSLFHSFLTKMYVSRLKRGIQLFPHLVYPAFVWVGLVEFNMHAVMTVSIHVWPMQMRWVGGVRIRQMNFKSQILPPECPKPTWSKWVNKASQEVGATDSSTQLQPADCPPEWQLRYLKHSHLMWSQITNLHGASRGYSLMRFGFPKISELSLDGKRNERVKSLKPLTNNVWVKLRIDYSFEIHP